MQAADSEKDWATITTTSLRGTLTECIPANIVEGGALLVHAQTLSKVLAKTAKPIHSLPTRVAIDEDPDNQGVIASVSLPAAPGMHARPLMGEPFDAWATTQAFVMPRHALPEAKHDWENALTFSIDASALLATKRLLAPIKASKVPGALPKIFLEIASADELIISACSGPAAVVQRSSGDFEKLETQLRKRGMQLPLEIGVSMECWQALDTISTRLPKGGVVKAEVALGVDSCPSALKLADPKQGWEISVEALRRADAFNPRPNRERTNLPILNRATVADKIGLLNLLGTTLAFNPKGVAIGVSPASALSVIGSSLAGMFDLSWAIEELETIDDEATDVDLVLPPKSLKAALDALPADIEGTIRLAFLGGEKAHTLHEAQAITLTTNSDNTQTTVVLAGKHR